MKKTYGSTKVGAFWVALVYFPGRLRRLRKKYLLCQLGGVETRLDWTRLQTYEQISKIERKAQRLDIIGRKQSKRNFETLLVMQSNIFKKPTAVKWFGHD